jgi:neprosin-like protein
MKIVRIVDGLSIVLVALVFSGCTIRIGPFDDNGAGVEDKPSVLPEPKPPSGEAPVPSGDAPVLDAGVFAIFQGLTGDWWIAYQGDLLGYYPAGLFKTSNGGACRSLWYGEVARWKPASATAWPKTETGSGQFPEVGALYTAYVRNPRYYDPLWVEERTGSRLR